MMVYKKTELAEFVRAFIGCDTRPDEEKFVEFLMLYMRGFSIPYIAKVIGVSRYSVYQYRDVLIEFGDRHMKEFFDLLCKKIGYENVMSDRFNELLRELGLNEIDDVLFTNFMYMVFRGLRYTEIKRNIKITNYNIKRYREALRKTTNQNMVLIINRLRKIRDTLPDVRIRLYSTKFSRMVKKIKGEVANQHELAPEL